MKRAIRVPPEPETPNRPPGWCGATVRSQAKEKEWQPAVRGCCAHRAKFQYTPGIIQRPLATIRRHLGTPAKVVCGGPLGKTSRNIKKVPQPGKANTAPLYCGALRTEGYGRAGPSCVGSTYRHQWRNRNGGPAPRPWWIILNGEKSIHAANCQESSATRGLRPPSPSHQPPHLPSLYRNTPPTPTQGCTRREGATEAAPEAVG